MTRYKISYVSGATGYGWDDETNSRAEAKRMVKGVYNYTAEITVWDREKKDFIYWKRCLCYKPDTDLLNL